MDDRKGYWVYILRCADQTLYSGATTHLLHRLQIHNEGKGAKYTRSRLPVLLLQAWQVETWSQALRLEYALKKCSRALKEEFVLRPENLNDWALHVGLDFSILAQQEGRD